jgi:hypothetical protein
MPAEISGRLEGFWSVGSPNIQSLKVWHLILQSAGKLRTGDIGRATLNQPVASNGPPKNGNHIHEGENL